MIIPIRDFSTGKPIAQLWENFDKLVKEGKSKKDALDSLEVTNISCRISLLGHVEMIDIVGRY